MSNGTTIQDIANRANVSKSTVSRVLNNPSAVNEEKREAVLEAVQTLGFQPNMFARGLASGQSMTIGIVTQNIGSPFYDTITQGIIAALDGTGYSPIFVDGQWQESTELEVIQTLLGRRVDGLLLVGGVAPESKLDPLKDQAPAILVGRRLPGWDDRSIVIDNKSAAYDATNHLLELGHRNIAHVRGIKHHPDATQRLDGYKQALLDAGIEFDPQLVYQGDFSAQSGVLAVNSWLSQGTHFSALFAANDMSAFGARLALYRKGIRVPDDVSIVGFDDQAESAFLTPPLTTVRQPAAEMGTAAAQALVKLIKGEPFELLDLTAQLQVRESAARLR